MAISPKVEAPVGTISALYSHPGALVVSKGPENDQTVLLDLGQLKPCRYQKRVITTDRVRSLAENIKKTCLIYFPLVRLIDGVYELIVGERRWQAFQLLYAEATTDEERQKYARLPCTLRTGLSEVQVAAIAATENIERDNGSPVEQGLSLLEVKSTGGFSNNSDMAQAIGMSAQKVTRLIRLAEAPQVMQTAVAPGLLIEQVSEDGAVTRRHKKLEVTLVLEVGPLWKHVEKTQGTKKAEERIAKLLERAARGDWTRAKLTAEVRRRINEAEEEASTEDAGEDTGERAHTRRLLYRDKGPNFTIYLSNLPNSTEQDRVALVTRLRSFIARIGSHSDVDKCDGTQ